MISESVVQDAKRKYGDNIVNAILCRDSVLGRKYLIPICKFIRDDGANIDDVFSILKRIGRKKIGNIWEMSYKQFLNAYETKFPNDVKPLPNPCFYSSDKQIEIGRIDTWEEAQNIPMNNTWCISREKDSWNDFQKRGYTFYIIKNFRCSFSKNCRYVLFAKKPNGAYDFSDSTNNTLVQYSIIPKYFVSHMSITDYLQSLGKDGIRAIENILGHKILEIKENKQYKNMNRIKLTESQLHRVIKESVKKVLNEIGDTKEWQAMLGYLLGKKYLSDAKRGDDNASESAKKIYNYAKMRRQEKMRR